MVSAGGSELLKWLFERILQGEREGERERGRMGREQWRKRPGCGEVLDGKALIRQGGNKRGRVCRPRDYLLLAGDVKMHTERQLT